MGMLLGYVMWWKPFSSYSKVQRGTTWVSVTIVAPSYDTDTSWNIEFYAVSLIKLTGF